MRQHKLKKIAVATALALSGSLLAASGAHAAGLGQLTVLSGLGQPLRAEIDLTSVTRQEASTLAGKMAGPDAYRQAGVEMSPAMLGVRVAVNRRANGNYYLSLSTVQPVNDPFVDALIEVNWASGRLVREYTFLLDPADMKPVSPPVIAAAPAPAAAPVAPPVAAEPPAAAPAPAPAPAASEPAPAASTPAPAVPDAVKPTEEPKAAPASGGYTVKSGDTAAKIAGKNKPEGVSLDQMLVALYRSNQDAFVNGNINRLKSGVILNLPDKEAASAVAPDDAHRLLVAQSADWKAYQDKVAGTAQTAPAPVEAAPKKESKGRITAKVQDQAQKNEARDQLKLSKADSAPAKGSKKGAAASGSRVSEEDLVAKERALKDANSRVAELEKNVRDLQKLVEVKNQNLADLQKQAAQAKADAKKAPEPVKAAPPPPPAPPVVAKAEPPKVEPPKAVEAPKAAPPKAVEAPKAPEPPKAVEPVKAPDAPKAADAVKAPDAPKAVDAGAASTGATAVAAADATKPADATVAPPPTTEPPKAVEPPKAPPKKAAPPPPPPPEPSLMDELLGNPLYLGLAGLVIVLLVGYAAFAVRRKRKVDSFESSIITGGDLKANSVFGNTGGQSVDTGNSSFQSDFSQVGPGAIDADEVDPVAEADVYMAYGRDAQAEEILKEALVKDPNRQTVRMKLLEIYSQRRDPAGFAAAATELRNATGGQGEQWNRAAALGHQIDPSNPMYGGSGAAAPADNPTATQPLAAAARAAASGAVAAAQSDFSTDKTLTLNSFHPPHGAVEDPLTKTVALEALQNKGEAPDIDLDFDLGGDTTKEKASAPDFVLDSTTTAEQAPAGNGNDVDFDLGFGNAPAAPAAAKPAGPETDFSPSGTLIMEAPMLGGTSGEKTVEMAPMGIPEAPTEEGGNNIDFDFDIGAPQSAAPAPAGPTTQPAAGNGMDFDLSSISLDLPAETAGAGGNGASDDAATKLDLAKAYHEMGDKDGAKELLGEVLKEGSAVQQAEAKQLLASI